MSEHSSPSAGVIHDIRWNELCPWLILVKALRVALLVRVLIIAAVGVFLTQVGWALISSWFAPDLAPPGMLREQLPTLNVDREFGQVFGSVPSEGWQSSTLVSGWYWLTEPFLRLGDSDLSTKQWLGTSLYGLWAIAVWALVGGAICRITAMYLTRGEILGPLQALATVCSVWFSTLGGPLIVFLAVFALAVPLMLLGALLRVELIAIVAAVLWCFVLAWGFMLLVILLGLMLGWPLMWACLSVERSDAFDGVSRCYAYVYQRPLRFGFYVLVAVALGVLGDVVVQFFASVSVTLSEWTVSWGLGADNAQRLLAVDLETSSTIAQRMILYWKWALKLVAVSFPVACLWPMSVGIYLLLRLQVDATEMEEITLADGTVQVGLPKEQSDREQEAPAT